MVEIPLRTERLVIRYLRVDDIDEHERLFSNADVVRYLYEEPLDREAAIASLSRRMENTQPAEGAWLNLAVEAEGRFLGELGLHVTSASHRQCEVGYVFLPEAQGHGYATEATAALLVVAFEELGAHRVVGRLDARNSRSARLLERLGMRKEAHFRENEWVKGEWTDEAVFAITEEEWRARTSG